MQFAIPTLNKSSGIKYIVQKMGTPCNMYNEKGINEKKFECIMNTMLIITADFYQTQRTINDVGLRTNCCTSVVLWLVFYDLHHKIRETAHVCLSYNNITAICYFVITHQIH